VCVQRTAYERERGSKAQTFCASSLENPRESSSSTSPTSVPSIRAWTASSCWNKHQDQDQDQDQDQEEEQTVRGEAPSIKTASSSVEDWEGLKCLYASLMFLRVER